MPRPPRPPVPPLLHRVLPRVQKPARYVGNERNLVRKNGRVDLRMVISYPDIYEIGMSNLGLRILYESVNAVENLSCERVFAPWRDFEEILRKHRVPLYSLESFTPLHRFDVLGFSLGYELLCTNVLAILDLGGIPLRSADRGEECPIVIAGGPAAFNPEPLADFIDVFLLGDGEKALVEFLLAAASLKGRKREERLGEFDKFDFTYVPPRYGTRAAHGYLYTDVGKVTRRRVEHDLDVLPYPRKPIVPVTRIVQERVSVEVSRGCVTGCRFCQAGFVYRPVRERSVPAILDIVDSSLKQTGYEEVSLLSLNVGAFSALEDLVRAVTERHSAGGVSVSLPSLKVNSVNLRVLEMVRQVRKSGLTFAVESPDELVRAALNKPVGGEQLREIFAKVTELGWKHVKLYFMIGLPNAEGEGEAIERFLLDLAAEFPRLSLNASVSVFVPKAHTPFEREAQMPVRDAELVIHSLRKSFTRSRVSIRFQNPRMSLVEGILSRGDRRLGGVLEAVFGSGERFSSWDDEFDFGKWEIALKSAGIDAGRYLSFDAAIEPLPWGHIDAGVKRDFLSRERERSRTGTLTGSCLEDDCAGCGVCGGCVGNRSPRSAPGAARAETREKPSGGDGGKPLIAPRREVPTFKVVFRFVKQGLFRYISHLDLLSLLARALRMTELPVATTKGFNPKPRLSLPFPLLLGAESTCEIGEVYFLEPVAPEPFIRRMNEVLDEDLRITEAETRPGGRSLASKPFFHEYTVTVSEDIKASIETICANNNNNSEYSGNNAACRIISEISFSVLLEGTTSIKDFLGKHSLSHLDCEILRTRLGEDRNGEFYDFFR
jgi:radical SAM family uncharacterized protein